MDLKLSVKNNVEIYTFERGGNLTEKFKQLDPDKKKRILDAAFLEFSEQGYDKTSTNTIAKNAGIGKGTLFYYFESKEKLFHYAIEAAFEIANDHFLSKIDYQETDFFVRLRESTKLKWDVYLKHANALSFMAHIFMNFDQYDLPEHLKEKREVAEAFWANILRKNIDFSKFREDIPAEISFNFILWTMEGYRKELEARFKFENLTLLTDEILQPYYDEFYTYLDALKKIYYKPECIDS